MRTRAVFRADAAMRHSFSQDRESRAGEMLQPAGYRPAGTRVRAGGWSAGRGWFCWNVLRSVHACCLPQSAKQDGLRGVAFLFRHGSGSPVARSRIAGAVIRLGWFTSGLRVFCGDPDGSTRGRGGRRRRGVGALLRDRIGFAMFSAGSPLGRNVEAALRPRPRLRQRVFDSLDSLHLIRGVDAFYAGRGTRV